MAQNMSFIRWAGGKSWLVPYVQNLIQDLEYNNYFEPFMEGASIFFSIKKKNKCSLSDLNAELVNAFVEVRDNVDAVTKYLKSYSSDSDSYYRIRALEPTIETEKAARFLYLNATSYNGLYRVNKQGKYNVPYGQKNIKYNFERLYDVHQKLQGVCLNNWDFDEIRPYVETGDLIFLDPPYTVSRKENGFIEYNATLFSLDDQIRLAKLIDFIQERGAYYILTNAAHETIWEIFKDRGRTVTLERNSLIGGKNAFRGKVQEYIFTNIPERRTADGKN